MASTPMEYDYIIIGAGSAGSVLAHRLSEDPDVNVLVLEAGPKDKSIFIDMPVAFSEAMKGERFNWDYYTEPEPYMDNRRIYCPRGRVFGGSSSINGMVYIRGHAKDYDRWAGYGLDGWEYKHCLPYFKRAQDHELGANTYRGEGGPMHVARGRPEKNPLYEKWIEAGQQAGYPYTDDVNGYQQEGVGPFDRTTYKGERWSAGKGYLRPALKRPNLTIISRAYTEKVIIENNRAKGAVYVQGSSRKKVYAKREVIVSGGAINSPKLLQLSGIGPADHLMDMGVKVVADRPGVGANLQDHPEIYVQYECKEPITMYPSIRPFGRLKVGLKWIFGRRDPGATNLFEAGGFIRSRPGIEHPNLQFHFLPIAVNYDGRSPAGTHGFQAHVGPMRSTSKGYVRIRSNDPHDHPEILFNYMQTENDRQEMREAVRLTREIIEQKAFDRYRGKPLNPGPEVQTDEEIDAFIREKMESAYHPSCTCKMGTEDDEMAVVDHKGRVHGFEGLRVVDASIMPDIVSGNLDAPTIMMAEKLSDAIRGRDPLPAEDAAVYQPKEWEIAQR